MPSSMEAASHFFLTDLLEQIRVINKLYFQDAVKNRRKGFPYSSDLKTSHFLMSISLF